MNKLIRHTVASAVILSSLGLNVDAKDKYMSDADIKATVDDIYNHYPEIDRHVNVKVNQGYVTIDGEVDKYATRDKAEDLVEKIAGVKDVNNKITIAEDTELKNRIQAALFMSTKLDSKRIDVYVEDGTVTLEGYAKNAEAKRLATEKAFKAGASDVKNNLNIM